MGTVVRAREESPGASAAVIALVSFHLCRCVTLLVTARLRDEMERDDLEAMGQTSGLYSVLLTAKMLQGKIK